MSAAAPLPSRPEPERETPGWLVSPFEDRLPDPEGQDPDWTNEEAQRRRAAALAANVQRGLAAPAPPPTPRNPDFLPAPTRRRPMSAAERRAIMAGEAGTPRDPDE